MNDPHDTRPSGPLSLAERAKHGLLPDSLSIPEIAELEHPTDLTARAALEAALRSAVKYGDLPERLGEYDDGVAEPDPAVFRRLNAHLTFNRHGRF